MIFLRKFLNNYLKLAACTKFYIRISLNDLINVCWVHDRTKNRISFLFYSKKIIRKCVEWKNLRAPQVSNNAVFVNLDNLFISTWRELNGWIGWNRHNTATMFAESIIKIIFRTIRKWFDFLFFFSCISVQLKCFSWPINPPIFSLQINEIQ